MMKNLPASQEFFPQSLKNLELNKFKKSDRSRSNISQKRSSYQNGCLSFLVDAFRPDEVQSMVETPAKRPQSNNCFSQLVPRPSTNNSARKNWENYVKTQNILAKAQKLQYSLSDLQSQIKDRQKCRKNETLSKMTSQQNLITFYNLSCENQPFTQKNINKIKSIKDTLNKIKCKSSLNSVPVFSDKRNISKIHHLKKDDSPFQINKTSNKNTPRIQKPQLQNTTPVLNKKLAIDDFQFLFELGSGIYGAVSLFQQIFFYSRHKSTKLLTAIKTIPKAKLNPSDHTYLTRQIKLQTFSYHPNIAQIYAFFDNADFIYLVLEFCNQGNLYDLVKDEGGKLPETKVKRFMKNICEALSLLHSNNIIHRDLKPQNILVSNGVAKLCDFGWAVRTPDMRNTFCGTPLYSSPQLIKSEHYDRKIDIWSLGIMAYEFIYGKGPFDLKTRDDLYKIVEHGFSFPENDQVSEECRDFINSCLQKQPADRPQIWELLSHPFLKGQQKIRDSIKVSQCCAKEEK